MVNIFYLHHVSSRIYRSKSLYLFLFDRHEFKHNHEDWITSVKPALDSFVSEKMHERLEITDLEIENFRTVRNDLRSALNALLKVCSLALTN